MRNKAVFFVKREKMPLPDGNVDLADFMAVGDIYPNVLGRRSPNSVHIFITLIIQIISVLGLKKFWSQYSTMRIT